MKKIYVSHPFQNKKSNFQAIAHICRLLSKMGVMPISPVHSFSYLNDNISEEREKAMEYCEELVEIADAIFMCGDWRSSDGCNREHNVALIEMIPIYEVIGWKNDMPVFGLGGVPKWFNYKEVKGGNYY